MTLWHRAPQCLNPARDASVLQIYLSAKYGHSAKTVKTTWQEQKVSDSCSYIHHKKTHQHTSTKLITRNAMKWQLKLTAVIICAKMLANVQ